MLKAVSTAEARTNVKMLNYVKYTVANLAPDWLHPLLWVYRSQPPPSVSLPTNQAESTGMSWSRDQSWQAAAEPWEETTRWSGRNVEGSAAWLQNMRRGMDRCAQDTIQQVRDGLLQIKMMEADGQAEAGLTENMQKAIVYLQDRQTNLDRQRQRTIVLDT